MWDLCVIRYKKLAKVDAVLTELLSADTFELAGTGFSYATNVFLNGSYTAGFQVVSDRRMVVTIPTTLKNQEILSIVVYADTQGTDAVDDMEFALTKESRSGLARVVQSVVKLLLSTAGTDKYAPDDGASLAKRIQKVSLSDPSAVTGVVASSVQQVERQIAASQTDLPLPPEDRLVAVRLGGVNADVQSSTVSMSITVVTAAEAGLVAFAVGGA